VLAGALITVGLTQTSGAAPVPMPFLSPTGNPPPGCVYPTAPQGMRVISHSYDPLYRLISIVALVSGFESSKQTASRINICSKQHRTNHQLAVDRQAVLGDLSNSD
jgi:hypothetical protein